MENLTIIEKLKKIQSRLFCSPADLARVLGVDRAQITRWLAGTMPSPANIEKIDHAFNKVFKYK